MRTVDRFTTSAWAVLFVAFSCACSTTSHDATCSFNYDKVIQRTVIIPTMRKVLGEGGEASYNLNKPLIHEDHGKVVFVFLFNDENTMDPPKFELVLDPCSMRVLSAGESTAITPD